MPAEKIRMPRRKRKRKKKRKKAKLRIVKKMLVRKQEKKIMTGKELKIHMELKNNEKKNSRRNNRRTN